MTDPGPLRKRFEFLQPHLNERTRRLWAAAEAQSLGHGRAIFVERCTGVSRQAIRMGMLE